jgi:hypothetical protein
MKNIVYQFYNEGFATLFCLKPINYIKNNISNKSIVNLFSFVIRFLYTIAIISLIVILTYLKYC